MQAYASHGLKNYLRHCTNGTAYIPLCTTIAGVDFGETLRIHRGVGKNRWNMRLSRTRDARTQAGAVVKAQFPES